MAIDVCKALFVWNKNEKLHDKVVELIDLLKKELRGVGIGSIMEVDEEHDKDEDEVTKGCNIAIIFITPGFLKDLHPHLSDLIDRFQYDNCFAFIVDDHQNEFVKFIKLATYDCYGPGDDEPHPVYGICVNYVYCLVKGFIISWVPQRCTFIFPEDQLPNIDPVVEAARRLLNSTGFDFSQIDSDMYSSLKALDRQILLDRQNVMNGDCDGPIVAVLVGCQCHCLDMSAIAVVLYRFNETNSRDFIDGLYLPAPKIGNGDRNDDPFALRDEFLRRIYSMADWPIEKLLSFHHEHIGIYPWFVLVQDLDFSNHHLALSQLKSLADILLKGSLVYVTTRGVTTKLALYKNLVSLDRGTTCKEPIKWRIMRLSQIEQERESVSSPMDTQVELPTSKRALCNQMMFSQVITESVEDQESGSVEKKPKITSF